MIQALDTEKKTAAELEVHKLMLQGYSFTDAAEIVFRDSLNRDLREQTKMLHFVKMEVENVPVTFSALYQLMASKLDVKITML